MTFEELGVMPELLRAIEELGYEQPMPIQAETIPVILQQGRDLVGLAQTGTGKTAAFGLPLLQSVDIVPVYSEYQIKKDRKTGKWLDPEDAPQPQALILAPTRELCLQIASDLQDYAKYLRGIAILPVYGGSSIGSQIGQLKRGVHVVVATPGRLIDLIERGACRLDNVKTLVMDEADEMLSMGFQDDIETILQKVPTEHRTMLFSATMPKQIAAIAKKYMTDPIEITIGNKNEGSANVSHVYYFVHAKDKYAALKRIVDYYPNIYGIIFCRTKAETQEIAKNLMDEGYNADALHGDLSQEQRDMVMHKFRTRHLQLLVATDVAARGLDVDDLTHVINYGLPDDVEVYTHRSGRTGRAGKKGISIAIVHVKERRRLNDIERIIGKKFEKGQVPTTEKIIEKQLFGLADRLEKVEVKEDEIAQFLEPVAKKLGWLSNEDLLKRIVSLEFNRMLEFYKGSENLDIPEERPKREKPNRGEARNASYAREYKGSDTQAEPGYSRLFINLGKRDGIFPKQLIGLMNSLVHHRIEMGRIDLLTNFSYFEVPEKDARFVIKDMTGADWRGRQVSVQMADAARPDGSDKPLREKKFGKPRSKDRGKDYDNEKNRRNYDGNRYFGERMQHKPRKGRRESK
ncbi:MAG: DEAD/DEAH box helicase [Bacteroidales bacterium]|jgi:ATP-dependent RNA helicase DeaD|nr:DEAD/DEAH box helicase [Bacteroidales bacterium]